LLFNDNTVNVLNNDSINRGVGWKNNQSFYSGSELSFISNNSRDISFEFDTNSKADQGAEIIIDEKKYSISSPDLKNQKLSITVDKNKSHAVTVRHFCFFFYDQCQITLRGIYVRNGAKIFSYKTHYKILSVLGDSISTIYGKDNYSQLVANDLGYELHNARITQSTVSDVPGVNSAMKRYKKDLMSFKSDAIIIFLGTNDVAKSVSPNVFENDYLNMVSDLKRFDLKGKIFLVGALRRNDIEASKLQNYNNIVKSVAEKNNVYFIDSFYWLDDKDFSDDIHPSVESQKKLAKHFEDALSSILK